MTTISKPTTKDPVIVVLQLSGGNDYLNTVVPYTKSEYRDYRPTVNVGEEDIITISDTLSLFIFSCYIIIFNTKII